MWIEMTRNTLVAGEERAIGEICEVEDQVGEALIFMKKARVFRQAEPAEEAVVTPDEAAAVAAEEMAILKPLEVAGRKRRKGK